MLTEVMGFPAFCRPESGISVLGNSNNVVLTSTQCQLKNHHINNLIIIYVLLGMDYNTTR